MSPPITSKSAITAVFIHLAILQEMPLIDVFFKLFGAEEEVFHTMQFGTTRRA